MDDFVIDKHIDTCFNLTANLTESLHYDNTSCLKLRYVTSSTILVDKPLALESTMLMNILI